MEYRVAFTLPQLSLQPAVQFSDKSVMFRTGRKTFYSPHFPDLRVP